MNLAQIRSAIQAEGYTTDTAAQQTSMINTVYRSLCGKQRWKFLEKQDSTLNTVNGTANYALPMADWRNLDAVRIQIPALTQFNNLQFLDVQDFREYYHIDRDVATPFYWTLFEQQLWFFPVPDQVYNVVIDYIFQPPDLALDADVPVIPAQYHDILVWGAVKYMAFRERDWIGMNTATQEYETLEKRLEEEYMIKQRQTSSHVRRSGYWSTQLPYPFIHDGF